MAQLKLVLQVYGLEGIFQEARLLLLSLECPLPAGVQVVIYSDDAPRIRGWNLPFDDLVIHELTEAQIAAWRGPHHFVHRFKIEAIRHAIAAHAPQRLLYLDSDIWLTHGLAGLLAAWPAEAAMMHEQEGALAEKPNRILAKTAHFVSGKSFELVSGRRVQIPLETRMYNAGLIGLHKNQYYLVEEVLQLTDALTTHSDLHILEQLAFSFVLSSQGKVYDASARALHYWYFKEMRTVLAEFFAQYGSLPFEALWAKAHALPLQDWLQQRWRWRMKPSWQRKLATWAGRGYTLPNL